MDQAIVTIAAYTEPVYCNFYLKHRYNSNINKPENPNFNQWRSGKLVILSYIRSGRNILLFVPLVTALMLLMSCVATTPEKKEPPVKREKQELVFPPPPEVPRYHFEGMLFSNVQVEAVEAGKESYWKKLLTGEEENNSKTKGLAKPYDVVACQGRVFVSDTVARLVYLFDFERQRFVEIGTKEPGDLRKPLGLNTDGDCNLYVADVTKNKIMIYNKNGEYISSLNVAGKFQRMSHLAVTADGSKIFIVDTGGVGSDEHLIRVFDVRTGDHLYDIGTRGEKEGMFNLPKDIEIGPDGNLYVVDSGNFRIQVMGQDGTFIRSFGTIGSRPGQFTRPKGIAIDQNTGIIYVVDTAFGNFQIFNQETQLMMHIGTRGNAFAPGVYMLPAGIDVDEDGRIYIVDQFFRKVDIYRPVELPASTGAIGRKITGTTPAE